MQNELKEKYFDMFKVQYNTFKSISLNDTQREKIFNDTCDFMDLFFQEAVEKRVLENWKLELQTEYGGIIYRPTPVVLRVNEPQGWYDKTKLVGRFFWRRYQQYLVQKKKWEQSVIDVIDDTTDEILRSIGDPKSSEIFDFRGLVLGYVQSGKTANFTGLINKAYDVGYKIVIVLSGIHNDLRAQTQLRLEEEVIGKLNKGVGTIISNDDDHFIHALTSAEVDVTGIQTNISYNISGNKTLLVVKKNKDVLDRLIELLKSLIDQAGDIHIPALIIDDEADQASIDTSDKAKGEDPKTINRLIRETLMLFNQKAYVGYTATPFANLLIGIDNETVNEGQDLYPKDFLVGLPKPENYCGPDEFFNTTEDANDNRPSLIIDIGEEDEKLFNSIKKKDEHYKVDSVPPKLKEALYAFLITVSIRALRGQENEHNSMLIHTSRFTLVQSSLKDVIKEEFNNIVNNVRFNPSSCYVKQIKMIYLTEFVKKTNKWNEATGTNYDSFNWDMVYAKMKEVCLKIDVMEINGESQDALEYHRYKEEGLNVIAVGGDKLSRGLTLEGLTISYYYRNTLMYDTLMQMGRWFGYRKLYLDLCRIYTSSEIASNFEHLAVAMHQLRKEFEYLKGEKLSPSDYAVRMMAHPKMILTSNLKMRNAQATYQNYSNKLHQTRLFTKEKEAFLNNMKVTTELINKVYPNVLAQEKKDSNGKGKTKYHVAEGVPVEDIISFLLGYQAYEGSTKSSTQSIIEYIRLLNKDYDELLDWKVVIVEGVPNPIVKNQKVNFGPLSLNYTVTRGQSADIDSIPKDRIDVKAIVAAGQERFDEESKRNGVSVPKLFIYPLNPNAPVFYYAKDVDFSENLVPIGIAVAFPKTTKNVDNKVFLKNKTIQEKWGSK
ncbi:Z1 domain-containing protein [Pullulanibacillus sp. KACC 23026]|uniref:Z1 domain-containing protein n=1 Tax=Pullulanibacillus sp. KACC 23026 TaxID=3028315 RepID=UPI0023AE970E|nr:Z1 domain-containing protein [Pullulanibacillus sp. KACC 23026]WEG11148.1 Z1 domain-containing protein [Pullulanibacillus sp. KACC 23026]